MCYLFNIFGGFQVFDRRFIFMEIWIDLNTIPYTKWIVRRTKWKITRSSRFIQDRKGFWVVVANHSNHFEATLWSIFTPARNCRSTREICSLWLSEFHWKIGLTYGSIISLSSYRLNWLCSALWGTSFTKQFVHKSISHAIHCHRVPKISWTAQSRPPQETPWCFTPVALQSTTWKINLDIKTYFI